MIKITMRQTNLENIDFYGFHAKKACESRKECRL